MISIFYIIWYLSTSKYLWCNSFDFDIICNILSLISYIWYCIWYFMIYYDKKVIYYDIIEKLWYQSSARFQMDPICKICQIIWLWICHYSGTYFIVSEASGTSSSRFAKPLPISESGQDVLIWVYSYIEPDIGYDIADTRYRDMSRYQDQYRDIPISGPNASVTISGHWIQVSRYRTRWRCLLFPAGPGPRAAAGFPAAIRSEVSFHSSFGQWNTRDFDIVAAL
jgi:hypothetical protein